jgi:hypothetical protein
MKSYVLVAGVVVAPIVFFGGATISRADIIVSSGYYDLTQTQFPAGLPAPNPWYGSPNTTFYGNLSVATSSDPDEDAILFWNGGANSVNLQALKIGSGSFDLFVIDGITSPVSIGSNSYAIFAGVDGSDTSFSGPLVNFTVDSQSLSYSDPTGPAFAAGALHGNTVLGSADETVPWTVGYSSATPEPGTMALLAMGLVGIAASRCRTRKPAAG